MEKESNNLSDLPLNVLSRSNYQNKVENVVQQFERITEAYPQKTAIVDGWTHFTYEQINARANQLANYLISRDMGKKGLVGVCIPQSANRIIAFLAILKIGAAYLPIDGELPSARIGMMIDDAKADLILSVAEYYGKFDNEQTQNIDLDTLFYEANFQKISNENPPVAILPGNPAYVIYTSGSTGRPKGVIISHKSFHNFVQYQATVLGLSIDNQTLQFASPSFDAAIIDIWTPLIKGATMHLYPNNKIVGEPLLDFIVTHHIDTVPLMPPMVLASLPQNRPIGKLQTIAIGGEACTEHTVRSWYKKIRLINSYGPTEATVAVTNYEFKEETNPRIIGAAIPFVNLLLLDSDLKPVAEGTVGELYIGRYAISFRLFKSW